MDDQLFEAIHEAIRKYNYAYNKVSLSPLRGKPTKDIDDILNITHYQMLVIMHNDGPLRISFLAKLMSMKVPNVSRLATKLIKNGWCEKIRKDGDKRCVYLGVTEKTRQYITENRKAMQEDLKEGFSKSFTTEELKKLLDFYTFAAGLYERFKH